jgi:hypothetical protein
MCDLVGSPYEDHQFIIECAAGRHGLLQTPAQAAQKARDLADYFMRLIRRKEQEPGDDLVSRVIEEHVRPGNLSREDFAEIGAMILRAGHDTTTNMIGLGTLILLSHPEQAAAVRDQPELVPGAVEELLRYISPVQFSPRRVAMEDVAIGDVVIRKGEGVFALNPAANRDPSVFPDPTGSTCIATLRITSRSASASISAWGRSSRAWNFSRLSIAAPAPANLRVAASGRREPLQGRHADLRGAQPPGGMVRAARRQS